jgi:hypothetical protein
MWLSTKAWDGTHWATREARGGTFISQPAAVAWGPNRLDVFALGTNSAMFHQAWDGVRWATWEALGGTFLAIK